MYYRLPLLFLLLLLGSCSSRDAERVIEQQFYVFGTVNTLTLHGVDEATAQQAGGAITAMFQQMHNDWHAWQKGELSAINAAIAEGKAAHISPSLIPLIEKSQEATRLSDGLFNPAIGKLIRLWGFQSSEMPSGPIPSAEAIAALVAEHPSMLDVEVKNGVITSRNRAVQFDFGGIAKGYAIALGLQRLRELGIKNAIINSGGGMGVIGSHGARPWRIGIRHPLGEGVLASVDVYDGEHIHTSGNYERFREWQGQRYSHIIDPRSGWPVQEVVSTTVIYNDGALADAFTKPFIVGGTREWQSFAHKLGVKLVMVVSSDGTVYMTSEMAQRAHFDTPPARVVVSGDDAK